VNYGATGKLNSKLSAGVEAREFEEGADTKISPVFSLGFDYQPFEGTTFSLLGYRNLVGFSSVRGGDVLATAFEISQQSDFCRSFQFGMAEKTGRHAGKHCTARGVARQVRLL
jgi:hypothetical protein